jgi:iterative type I PKS product template protein
MALTVADYIRRECKMKVPTTGINITEMEILGPVTVPVPRVPSPQLLRISAHANLDNGRVDLGFGTYSPQTKKTGSNAKCRVEYGDEKTWLHNWSRNAYLVQKRIEDLERGAREGSTDRMFRKMVYQLFSALVIYGPKYQGIQEVLVNTDELEATASLKLYEGADAGRFFASPLWIDNLAQLSGFVMNAIGIVDPRVAVYISHGWGSLQIAMPMDPTKPYRVHVKMQPLDKSIVAGNVSIFQGDTMVGLLGDVKFQKVPRPLLDTMLAPSSSGKTSGGRVPQITAPTAAPISLTKEIALAAPTPKRAAAQETPLTKILELVAEEIGVPVTDLTDDSDFSELGVDSLLSLTILSKIRETLQMDLSPSTFQECLTVRELRRFLGDSSSTSDEESDATIETPTEFGIQTPELLPEPTVTVLADFPPTTPPVEYSKPQSKPKAKKSLANTLLLQGDPNSASKTIFLFPDGSGSATSYAELPDVAPKTCVFAINSPFLKCPAEYTCSLEEVSRLMVDEIRSRQPKGPYILAGWSAGGMYAYEAAKHLMECGETVERLILIDSPCRLDYGPMPKDVLEYVSRSGVISGNATGTAPQWLVDHFHGTIRAVREYAPKGLESSKAPQTFIIWAAKGVSEDWPKAELAGLDLTDAVASWLLKPKADPGSQGWEKLLSSEKISCTTVEGNHFSMVHPPNVNFSTL